jgi:peptide/nickel transport system ATP-binding protein
MVPHPYNRPTGCPFHTRCDEFMEGYCDRILPPTVPLDGTSPESPRETRCLLYGGKDERGKE